MSTLPALALAASTCLLAAAFQGGTDNTAARLTAVEQQLAAQKKETEALAKEVAEARAQLEKTARYAAEQAKAAAALAETLDASEKAGFTYGINPESRQILLRGWREALNAAQRDVPAPPAPAPATAKSAK